MHPPLGLIARLEAALARLQEAEVGAFILLRYRALALKQPRSTIL